MPSGFVVTGANPAVPFPLNVIVFPPSPVPDAVAVSLPVIDMFLPHTGHFIGFNVRVSEGIVPFKACTAEFTGL
ncbi:Uncharacterised protein [uncultured archaeon]|nr:Uncharacterised protein [uncultured archaeon]